jgi:UDPglucose 6-dehydrogenase
MKVAVIGGTGYVGLVTGIGLTRLGHRVCCADIDSGAIKGLMRGQAPIREEGICHALGRALKEGRLSFTTDAVQAVAESELIIVAVGTPSAPDGKTDLSQVMSATRRIALGLTLAARFASQAREDRRPYKVIAIKSTVPVGTCENLRDILRSWLPAPSADFDVVWNPEFLREGSALRDFLEPDRIVVGAYRKRALAAMKRLYKRIDAPFLAMDPRSAEMMKYACNAFLAARVSFINEIAGISQAVGADVRKVAEGMGLDPRIGRNYLEPGLGFGGPCLGKDIRSLIAFGSASGARTGLLEAVIARNAAQLDDVFGELRGMLDGLTGKKIALLGLSFKAGTSDTRDSPSLALAWRLSAAGAAVSVWDPSLSAAREALDSFVFLKENPIEAAREAHCLVVATDAIRLGRKDLAALAAVMADPAIFDARRRLDPDVVFESGFNYRALGVSPRRLARKRRTPELVGLPGSVMDTAMAQ